VTLTQKSPWSGEVEIARNLHGVGRWRLGVSVIVTLTQKSPWSGGVEKPPEVLDPPPPTLEKT